ncbi:uncharacterized protein LOC143466286 isoform X2 [Clavelina lepadiformis]|uniref:uncharacterized protein LOC143466286 isoform X2 n=1 Tax=Clavelina lepadiformis TaxID=159417 RepID=UPI004041B53B
MANVGSDSWLEQELAELDEAEQFIQQTMSNFLPTGKASSNSKATAEVKGYDLKPAGQSTQVVQPKSPTDVDKLTNQLIAGLDTGKDKDTGHYDNFSLPPPPDLDDLILPQQKEPKSPDLPPPPPPLSTYPAPVPALAPQQPKMDTMSKPAPPPVLPKPSKSTPLQPQRSSVTILNKKSPTTKPVSQPPPVAPAPTSAPVAPAFTPAPVAPVSTPAPAPPASKSAPAPGIPKDVKKNSEEELDFLTNNLLSNMDNPKDEDFYGYCGKCNGVVEGEKVGCKALDNVYHITCFRCVACSRPLHGEPFYAVEKNAYCEPCYIASLQKCTVCLLTITDRILRATGKPYHPACFKCTVCETSLDGVPFTLDDDNKIYCVEDYHQKYAPRCSLCHLPILPEPGKEETVRIIALDRSFHVNCYKCEKCQVQLSSEQGCFPLDDHIFCRDCNTYMVQQLAA